MWRIGNVTVVTDNGVISYKSRRASSLWKLEESRNGFSSGASKRSPEPLKRISAFSHQACDNFTVAIGNQHTPQGAHSPPILLPPLFLPSASFNTLHFTSEGCLSPSAGRGRNPCPFCSGLQFLPREAQPFPHWGSGSHRTPLGPSYSNLQGSALHLGHQACHSFCSLEASSASRGNVSGLQVESMSARVWCAR